jgi:predicted PurR-regulated permease PerM
MVPPAPHAPRDREALAGFAVRVLIALALGGLALLSWRLHDVLLLLFGAVLVAVILNAAADGVCRIAPVPRGVALAIAALLILGLLGGAVRLFGAEIGTELSSLAKALPDAWRRFVAWVGEDRVQSVLSQVSPDGSTVATIVQTVLGTVTAALSGLVLAVLGGVYLAIDPSGYRRGVRAVLPRGARAPVDDAMNETGKSLRNWLFGQLVSMACTFAAVAIGLTLLDVPSALALAIVAGLLEFIPLVGPFLGAVPACLMALTAGVETFAWTVGFFAVWQQIEGNALAPLVMRYAVKIPPAVTLFALFLFGGLFGAVGVLLGGPLTVATWVMVKRLWVDPRAEGDEAA